MLTQSRAEPMRSMNEHVICATTSVRQVARTARPGLPPRMLSLSMLPSFIVRSGDRPMLNQPFR